MPEDSRGEHGSRGAAGTEKVRAGEVLAVVARDVTISLRGNRGGQARAIVRAHGELVLKAGQISVVLGPNGAGKSTLVKHLAGVLATGRDWEVGGEVSWFGQSLASLTALQRARACVYLSQVPMLSAVMPVAAVVMLGRVAIGDDGGRQDQAAAAWAMAQTGTGGFASRLFHELSAGQQQRVMLARGLCQLWSRDCEQSADWGRGKLLMLDEPASMLDPQQGQVVMRVLAMARSAGVCCCCVMHDLIAAGQMASEPGDQVIVVQPEGDSGARVISGSTQEMLTAEQMGRVFGARFSHATLPDGRRVLVPD
jgi:iron complex transport system ATP-binding protein